MKITIKNRNKTIVICARVSFPCSEKLKKLSKDHDVPVGTLVSAIIEQAIDQSKFNFL